MNTTLIVSGSEEAVRALAATVAPMPLDKDSGVQTSTLLIPDNLGNDPLLSHAFQIIKQAMAANSDYAWTWQSSLAMLIQDAAGADKVTHQRANEYAANFMRIAFEADVVNSEEYKTLETQWAAGQQKIKHALCFKAADLPMQCAAQTQQVLPIPEYVWSLQTHLADRRFCESNPDEQQLLPYLVAVNQHQKIFCYSRGAAGTEKRLVGNKSIGLGGHVDDVPQFDMSLYAWLQTEAERELMEEIKLAPIAPIQFISMLCDRTNEVGKVHLGLLAIVHVESPDTIDAEEGHIEKGEWLTIAELQELAKNGELENWSAMALTQLAD